MKAICTARLGMLLVALLISATLCLASAEADATSAPYRSDLVPRWKAFAQTDPVLSCIQVTAAPWNPPTARAVEALKIPFASFAPLRLTRPVHGLASVLTSDEHGNLTFSAELEAPGVVAFDGLGPESEDFGFVISPQANALGLRSGNAIPYARVLHGLSAASFPQAERSHQCGLTVFAIFADPPNNNPALRLLVVFGGTKLLAAIENDDGTH